MQNNQKGENLTESEWSIVSNAIPGFDTLVEKDDFKSILQLLVVKKGTILPADGMYVVLEGSTSLLLNGDEIATAGRTDYFYEEHLVIDHIATELIAQTTSDTRLMFLSKKNWADLSEDVKTACLSMLFGDLVNLHLHDVQQPINCCNITAAALSLTALGFPCEVNDIFKRCGLPVSYVVNDGMTISELYDVASSYVYAEGLRDEIGVELYFFDKAVMTKQDLFNAIAESDRVGGDKDILVANFGVDIAHGNSDLSGGHFALIAKCNQSTGLVHMMDVHPEKYGKIWVTSIDRLYRSMTDHDNSSMRSRGLMRFIVKKEVNVRLDALAKSDCYPVNCTQYIDLTPEKRRAIFSRSSTNLNSLCVLSMGISLLGNQPIDVDQILVAADLSYTEALTFETTSEQLNIVANDYLSSVEYTDIKCSYRCFNDSQETTKEAWFKSQLLSIANRPDAYLIINIYYNEVMGYTAISDAPNQFRETAYLREFWCICVDYLFESDVVILADMSPATSQIWRAPRAKVFAGLQEKQKPSLLFLEKSKPEENPLDFSYIIANHKLVLFYNDEDPWSYMLKSVLNNIGVTELHSVDVSGFDLVTINMRKKLTMHSGKEKTPYLYLNGNCLGEMNDVMAMVRDGTLQTMFHNEGLSVLMRNETPSLDNNIFSYPKGGLTEPRNGKYNVLLCSCGSSAADKIPVLVEMLVDAGHNVKLIPTRSSETFFKDVGMERVLQKLKPSDIYRDDDEWNFRYTEYGMPIRAAHLALCDWADCMVVAPITCNTMGKVAHGVADNLLSSVFVAWQYQKKPVILCPACNTNMWNNLTTQNNVSMLKRLGAHIEGPRSGILSNGRVGTGMMATVDEIMSALNDAFEGINDQARTVMKWGRHAAAADNYKEWGRIYRSIDEDVVGINIIDDENGDSLLHYASGGEGEINEAGIEKGVPDIKPMRELIARGIDINHRNDYNFSSLHVAIMNDSLEAVKVLLEAGADCTEYLSFKDQIDISQELREYLVEWVFERGIKSVDNSSKEQYSTYQNDNGELYFTYGSLKRDFPNHEAHAEILSDLVGAGITRQAFPLVVPKEASCSNPNCPYLHRMAALVDVKGKGYRVHGELYRIRSEDLKALDELEGYKGEKIPDNIYLRKKINVLVDDKIYQAYTYFIADAETHLDALADGSSEMFNNYTAEMSIGELKPDFADA